MPLFKTTGDGTCLYHTISVSLYEAILNGELPVSEKQEEFDTFLQHFSTFHPNFNPADLNNLKRWLKQYCTNARDIELLISPVLRAWYESAQLYSHDFEKALGQLPTNRHHCEESSVLQWLAYKFGFNILLETNHGVENISDIIGAQPGPQIAVKHDGRIHFDVYVSDNFSRHFSDRKDSFIMAHHAGNLDHAYTQNKNPLPVVSLTTDDLGMDEKTFYEKLKHFQHALQKKAMEIKIQELAIEGKDDTAEIVNNPLYAFEFNDDGYVPDHASLVLMYELLQQEAKQLEEIETEVAVKQKSLQSKVG